MTTINSSSSDSTSTSNSAQHDLADSASSARTGAGTAATTSAPLYDGQAGPSKAHGGAALGAAASAAPVAIPAASASASASGSGAGSNPSSAQAQAKAAARPPPSPSTSTSASVSASSPSRRARLAGKGERLKGAFEGALAHLTGSGGSGSSAGGIGSATGTGAGAGLGAGAGAGASSGHGLHSSSATSSHWAPPPNPADKSKAASGYAGYALASSNSNSSSTSSAGAAAPGTGTGISTGVTDVDPLQQHPHFGNAGVGSSASSIYGSSPIGAAAAGPGGSSQRTSPRGSFSSLARMASNNSLYGGSSYAGSSSGGGGVGAGMGGIGAGIGPSAIASSSRETLHSSLDGHAGGGGGGASSSSTGHHSLAGSSTSSAGTATGTASGLGGSTYASLGSPSTSAATSAQTHPPAAMTVRRAGGWRASAAHASAGARLSQAPSNQGSATGSVGGASTSSGAGIIGGGGSGGSSSGAAGLVGGGSRSGAGQGASGMPGSSAMVGGGQSRSMLSNNGSVGGGSGGSVAASATSIPGSGSLPSDNQSIGSGGGGLSSSQSLPHPWGNIPQLGSLPNMDRLSSSGWEEVGGPGASHGAGAGAGPGSCSSRSAGTGSSLGACAAAAIAVAAPTEGSSSHGADRGRGDLSGMLAWDFADSPDPLTHNGLDGSGSGSNGIRGGVGGAGALSPPGLLSQLPPLTPYPPGTPDGAGGEDKKLDAGAPPFSSTHNNIAPDGPLTGASTGGFSSASDPISPGVSATGSSRGTHSSSNSTGGAGAKKRPNTSGAGRGGAGMTDEARDQPSELPFGAGHEGQYDWANFMFAYSRGRWDPLRLPRPPGLSSLYPGTLTRIAMTNVAPGAQPSQQQQGQQGTHQQQQQQQQFGVSAGTAAAVAAAIVSARRPSLEYASSEEGSLEDFVPGLSVRRRSRDAKRAASKDALHHDPVSPLHPKRNSVPAAVLNAGPHEPERSATDPSMDVSRSASDSGTLEPAPTPSLPPAAATAAGSNVPASSDARYTGIGALDQGMHASTESEPITATLASVRTAEEKLKHREAEAGQTPHSQTAPTASSGQAHPDYVEYMKRPAAVKQQASGPSGGVLPEWKEGSESSKAGNHEMERTLSSGSNGSRPQPTPLQASISAISSPANPYILSAEGATSSFAEVMARKASQSSQGADPALYVGEISTEANSLEGLRRAARRTSFERQAAKLPIKLGEEGAALVGAGGRGVPAHSLSFPPDGGRVRAQAMTGPNGVLSLTEAKLGAAASVAGLNWKPQPDSPMPEREEPASFLRSSTSEAQQQESALQGLMSAPAAQTTVPAPAAMTRQPSQNQSSQGSSATQQKEGAQRPHLRKRTSSADNVPTSDLAAPSPGGDSAMNSYVAAGKRFEKFYSEYGYLPAVQPPNELDRRKALRRYGPLMATNPNFDRIAHLVKLVFNPKLVLISLVGEREQIFRSDAGGAGGMTTTQLQQLAGSRDCSFCGHAILQEGDEPVVILDAQKDWRFAGNPLVTGLPNIRFYAGSPLRTPDGFNIGSLCIIDDQPRSEFNPRQRHTLREFARVVMREMELLRDRMHFNARDRMQHSIENFTRECLEMDMEDSTEGHVQDAHGARKIYSLAAENVQQALQANGAVVFDLSHFELIESFPADTEDASTKIFFPSPYSQPDLKPFANAEKPDQVDVVDSPFWDQSKKDGALKSKLVPPMVVLGASEDMEPPHVRADPVPLSHHVQVAQFLRAHPTGRFYPYTPTPLRHLLPEGISRLLVVPIFGLNRQPFALLCAYSISSEEGGALEELKDSGLQYLRAIGMIILSAVLRKDIMLADKAKSHFISNISHELRTPLHGILAAAELLAETKLSSTQGSYLDTVEACGKSLLELVNHVLDFTKLSGSSRAKGLPNFSKTKCDLVRLVQEVCESSWIGQMAKNLEMAGHSGIGSFYAPPTEDGGRSGNAGHLPQKLVGNQIETVIEVSLREDGWLVNCDTGGIRRVLMNLIGNSLKFTTAGFVHVSLRELSSTDTHVVVELGVTDTGRGISRHFLEEQLFHPFTQENALGTGTGLGLSIVNSIVQSPSMNGKIDVWSTEGQGTEIKVTCELERADAADMEGNVYVSSLDVAGEIAVSVLGFGQSRGQQDLKEVLIGYLCGWWKFALADDSFENLGDMVVINENFSLLEQVRESGRTPLPPVILMTSSRGGSELATACDRYHAAGGVARILFKPCGPAKIEAVVDFCLQCIERVRQGKPPLESETKPDTPLPSPAQRDEENRDYFALETNEDAVPGDAETPQSLADLTPRGVGQPVSSRASSSGESGIPSGALAPGSKADGFHISPLAPAPNSSNSLIRRHSAEDRARSGKVLAEGETNPKRPMLPARSITYHEPRLHRHVLLSPMSRDKSEESADYFEHSHGSASSPSSTPGSTVSLDGGEGAILKNVVHSTKLAGGGASGKKKMQILSVEDNPINRRVIAAYLDKINADFVEAVNGEEGVKAFQSHPPDHFDVILMDLSMPVLDGLGATAAIRRIEAERYTASLVNSGALPQGTTSTSALRTKHALRLPNHRRVKIFALTGRSSDEDKRTAFATGADGYIVKPVSFKVLSSLLKMLAR